MAGWAEGELATTEIAYQYDELSRLTEANYSDGTYKIADPSSIKPHPNPKVASQGGLSGTIPGGGQIFYRPITSSGNPAIDTFNVPGYTVDWKYHFPPK